MLSRSSKNTILKQDVTGRTNYYGVYKARCLNNNDPLGLGRVLAHIYVRDGKLNYSERSHQWIPVLSPYGGIRGMGFYMIPPIHAEGFVIFEQGEPGKPIWIGTYPVAPVNELDQQASQSAGYGVVKVNPTIPSELAADATKIVLKTQYPSLSDSNPESNNNKIENLLLMDNTQFRLEHVNQAAYEFSPGGVSAGTPSSYLTLTDTSITMGVLSSEGKRYEISVTSEGITLKTNLGEQITLKDGSILIQGTDKSQIKIVATDNGSITAKAKNVVLDGEQIVLGPPGSLGGGGVITSDCICPLTGLPTHVGSSKVIVGG